MWIFTRWGFYSIASARQGDGGHENDLDSHGLVVQAIFRSQLEALKFHLPDLIGNCDIKEHSDSEYKFHMFVDKNIWSQVMLSLSQELNYDNFREEIVKEHSMESPIYLKTITDISNFMSKLQTAEDAN
ncbi:MAG: hypothetical protein P8M53_04115 [Pirellulales bacterium]|nr:hypothetical protein [Pirellulales bacterium]